VLSSVRNETEVEQRESWYFFTLTNELVVDGNLIGNKSRFINEDKVQPNLIAENTFAKGDHCIAVSCHCTNYNTYISYMHCMTSIQVKNYSLTMESPIVIIGNKG
jgi:hypothetical protein